MKLFSIGGIQYEGTENEVVVQQSVFTRRGVDRVLKLVDLRRLRRGVQSCANLRPIGYEAL